METTLSRLHELRARVADLLQLAPHTGRLWVDLSLLLLCALLHHAILPTFAFGLVPIDLMTPWLVVGFVRQTLARSVVLLVTGALLVELHSAAPAGLYVCAYWVIAVTLSIVRSSLSWWHAFPWVVTFALSELWIVLFEGFVRGVAAGGLALGPIDLVQETLRIGLSVALGMVLCRPFMRAEIVEGD